MPTQSPCRAPLPAMMELRSLTVPSTRRSPPLRLLNKVLLVMVRLPPSTSIPPATSVALLPLKVLFVMMARMSLLRMAAPILAEFSRKALR